MDEHFSELLEIFFRPAANQNRPAANRDSSSDTISICSRVVSICGKSVSICSSSKIECSVENSAAGEYLDASHLKIKVLVKNMHIFRETGAEFWNPSGGYSLDIRRMSPYKSSAGYPGRYPPDGFTKFGPS